MEGGFKNKKFTKDYKRINTFVKRRLQAYSPHQLYSRGKLYNRLDNLQTKPKVTPKTLKMVGQKYNNSINEELPTYTSSIDESSPHISKIFMLKNPNRRFWSPGVQKDHYSSTQNKAMRTIDYMLRFNV